MHITPFPLFSTLREMLEEDGGKHKDCEDEKGGQEHFEEEAACYGDAGAEGGANI